MVKDSALHDRLARHLHDLCAGVEIEPMRALRAATARLPEAEMQISPEQARLLAWLARSIDARRAIEVGTFTGYSALAVALVLPADGTLVACDVSAEWTAIGRPFWRAAGVEGRIDLRLGPAAQTLRAMLRAGEAASYDFAFIDADKEGYPDYFEQCLQLVRRGGVIAVDNMFRDGRVLDARPDPGSLAVRELTERAFADPRVDVSLVPIRDGVLLARVR